MLFDFFIICAFAGVVGIPISVIGFFSKRYFDIDVKWITGIIIFGIGLNKDYFRGKSIAKRAFGFVVLKKNGSSATRLQCFIRNTTILLAPLEVFISLFSRQRRLGDLLAGTKIEDSYTEPISFIVDEIKSELRNNNDA